MKLTLEWLIFALKLGRFYTGPLNREREDGMKLQAVLRSFIIKTHANSVAELEARIAKLEQFHCEHEFSNPDKGCLDSLFCAKCGVLSPDWEAMPREAMVATYPGAYEVWVPAIKTGAVWTKGCWYWRKVKEGKKK